MTQMPSVIHRNKNFYTRLLKRSIPPLFYAALLVFLYFYLRGLDFAQLRGHRIEWLYLLAGCCIGLIARYLGVFIWFTLLKSLGAKDLHRNIPQLIYVYAKSWLGRYIPGTAPWILGKIYFASQHGIPKNKLAVSSLLEGGLQIVVTMALSILLLMFEPRISVIPMELRLLMIGVLVVCVLAMSPAIFNRLVSLLYRLIRKKDLPKEDLATRHSIAKGAALYTIVALISGVALFFIAKAVYPELGYSNALFVMGAGNLAGAVSMLAVFAPSGIGVRESIQLVLLSTIMPVEFALLVTIITRLINVILDLLFFLISRLYLGVSQRKTGAR